MVTGVILSFPENLENQQVMLANECMQLWEV